MKHNNPNLVKRKKSIMEIVSSIIIWLSPLAVFGFIFILNYNEVVTTTTKTKIAGWFCFAFVILLIIYWKCLKKKLKERVLADKINEEKMLCPPDICTVNNEEKTGKVEFEIVELPPLPPIK